MYRNTDAIQHDSMLCSLGWRGEREGGNFETCLIFYTYTYLKNDSMKACQMKVSVAIVRSNRQLDFSPRHI